MFDTSVSLGSLGWSTSTLSAGAVVESVLVVVGTATGVVAMGTPTEVVAVDSACRSLVFVEVKLCILRE